MRVADVGEDRQLADPQVVRDLSDAIRSTSREDLKARHQQNFREQLDAFEFGRGLSEVQKKAAETFLGGALEMAVACDVTVAAEGCRFGAPEVRFGSGIVTLILPWVIDVKQARELLLTGDDRVSA